jgi:hypothetical protein
VGGTREVRGAMGRSIRRREPRIMRTTKGEGAGWKE